MTNINVCSIESSAFSKSAENKIFLRRYAYKKGMLESTKCYEKRKSSGNDGLTKEFYLCFFNEISDSLVAALNRSFEVNELSSSQGQAVIVLIEKKEKDKRLIKNWRPISLINVDSKIASKALAMKTVLSNRIRFSTYNSKFEMATHASPCVKFGLYFI